MGLGGNIKKQFCRDLQSLWCGWRSAGSLEGTEENNEEQGWWIEPQLEVTLCLLSSVWESGGERWHHHGPE